MNNKLMARIVAVVLSVMMLGTVAFAAPALNEGVVTNGAEGDHGTQKTMIAFAAATADATAPADPADILAIDQATTLEPTVTLKSVPATGYVIVAYGGDAGEVERFALPVATVEEAVKVTGEAVTCEVKSLEIGGIKYRSVLTLAGAAFDATNEGKDITEIGYEVADKGTIKRAITDTTYVRGDGRFALDILFYNVPDGTTLTATPYAKY